MNLPSRWQAPVWALLSVLVLTCFPGVSAQEAGEGAETGATATTVESKIVAITLYSSQARVVRELEIPGRAGIHDLRVGPLPAIVIDSSLEVEGAAHLKVLGVRVERESGEEQASPEYLELEARHQQLDRQIEGIERRGAVARARFQRYLDLHVAAPPRSSEAPAPVKIQPASWKVFLEVVREGLVEALHADQEAGEELYPLREQRAAVFREMAQLEVPDRDTETRAVITVQNTSGEPGTLRVSYRVPRAFWYPSYALHIDPATKKLHIVLYAVVHQRTGEAWPEIPFEFSSSIPESGAGLPDLYAQHITRERYEEQPIALARSRQLHELQKDARKPSSTPARASAVTRSLAYSLNSLEEQEQETHAADDARDSDGFAGGLALHARKKSKRRTRRAGDPAEARAQGSRNDWTDVAVLDGKGAGFNKLGVPSARFKRLYGDGRSEGRFIGVPGGILLPVDSARGFLATWTSLDSEAVPSDGAPHRLLIGNLELAYREQRTLVPELSTHVYRRLKAVLTGDHPLLAGQGAVFFGDAYLGTAHLATTAPGEDITVDLGVDDRMRVKRETFDREQDTGVFSKGTLYSTRVEIEIESFRDAPVTVEVWERVPFTEQEKITVEIDRRETRPTPGEIREHSGLVKWSIQVAARGKQELQLAYHIDAPRNFQLTRAEDPGRLEEGSQ